MAKNPWEDDPVEFWANDPIEEPVKSKRTLGGKTARDFLPTEKEMGESLASLQGLGETALHLGTGAIGGGLGTLFGTIAGIRQHGFGSPEVEKEASRQAESLTYAPRTEKGKEYAGKAGEVVQQLIPIMPMMPMLEGVAAATKSARALKAAGKPTAPPPGGFAPDVPLTLDEAIAQVERAPENQLAGPRGPTTLPWEADPIVEPVSKRAKLQMELPLEEPAPIAVSPQGTAMVTPEQVAGYEQYGRRMETPEAPVQEPLRGQGDLFMNEEVSGPIASPINAAERGALPETITENPALARRQMELQLQDEGVLNVSPEGVVTRGLPEVPRIIDDSSWNQKKNLSLDENDQFHHTMDDGTKLTFDKVDNVEQGYSDLNVYHNGQEIGGLRYTTYGTEPVVYVKPEFRRKGIASMLYDLAEANGGKIPEAMSTHATRSYEGQAFRMGREAKRQRLEPDVLELAQRNAEAKARELQAKQAVENGETGNLFADYVNQHRDYELFRDENGQPLSRSAFNETVDNLAKEKSTGYVRPENMDEAYAKYLSNFEGVQAGLFDQPTTALEMAQTLKNDATSRLVARHPLVKAAERFLNQEQQFLDQLKQQGATAGAIADAARDVAKAAARLEKTTANVEAGIKGGTKPAALKRKPTEVQGKNGEITYMYEGIGETIRRIGSFSNILSMGLDSKYSPEALRNRRIEVTPGEARQKFLPQGVKEGLKDYTKERRSAEAIAEDISKNNIPDIKATPLSDKVQAGGLYKGLETNNPIVRKTFAAVSEAYNNAHTNIRTFIQDKKNGLPALFRQLNKKEAGDWWAARMVREGVENLTPEQMRELGMNEKQIKMNTRLDEALDFAFQRINEARALVGKDPIDKRIGYLAGQVSGDFRRVIYKAGTDEVVGVLGNDSRFKLNTRVNKLLADHPEWSSGPEKMANRQRKDSRQKAFEDAVEMMVDKNPETKALLDAYDQILKDDAYNYMNAKKHTMQKKGVSGTEGFKLDADAWTNAKEGMASQIRYLEKMMNWAEMVKAVDEVRPLLSNENINMPNAKKWSSDYIDRALGIQTSKIGHALDSVIEAVGDSIGMGPSAIERGVGMAKGAVSKTLLGFLNPMFLAINLIQPAVALPAMNSLLRSRGISNASMLNMAPSMMSFIKMGMDGKLGKLSPFERTVMREGEARNLFGSEIFDHTTHLRRSGYVGNKIAEVGIPTIEGYTRGITFTYFARLLEKSGMKMGRELFDIAENLTNQTMTDYRNIEAPSIYKEFGAVGEMAVTLQRYKHNSLSSLAMLAREASRNKSYRPLATALASGVAFSGLTGMLGFNEADAAYQMITKMMDKPDTLTRLAMDKLPDVANFGVISALSGIDMSKRFGMALFPDSPSGVLFPGASKLADIGGAALDVAASPSDATQWERLAREATPGVLKGAVDRAFFEDEEGRAINPRTLEATVERTPMDKFAKSVGGVGLEESKTKARLFQESKVDKVYSEKRQKVTNRILDDLYQIDPKDTDAMRAYFKTGDGAQLKQDFIDAEGNIDNLVAAVEKFRMGGKTTAMQRKMLSVAAAQKEGDVKRAKRYKEMSEE